MSWKHWLGAGLVAGGGLLVYGALVEADRLVLERRTLRLPSWPESLNGFRLGLLADLHIRDRQTCDLSTHAIEALVAEEPDMIAIAGDFVGRWKSDSPRQLGEALAPLARMQGRVVAVPGNHDYYDGDPSILKLICDDSNIKLLRNETISMNGINWVGIDSANECRSDPYAPLRQIDNADPIVVVWHEPDNVYWLPLGADLMLSGHSHGGQFLTPWGWAPMHTDNGRKYVRGFYPDAPTALYVSRGLGTTGPPSRLFCPPEVTLLTIERAACR